MEQKTARFSICAAFALTLVAGPAQGENGDDAGGSEVTAAPDAANEPSPTVAGAANEPPRPVDNDVAKRPVPDESQTGNGQRNAAYVVGSVGIVALGLGSFFGLRAISKWQERKDECAAGCTESAKNAGDDAKSAARLSDVGFGVGLVALGVGIYLLSSAESAPEASASRDSSREASSWQLIPTLNSSSGGLLLRGRY